jgi:hypothetical protein
MIDIISIIFKKQFLIKISYYIDNISNIIIRKIYLRVRFDMYTIYKKMLISDIRNSYLIYLDVLLVYIILFLIKGKYFK